MSMSAPTRRKPDGLFKPFEIGGFAFTAVGARPSGDGRPSWAGYQAALAFAQHSHQASGWWLADLLAHGESRADWADRLVQAQEATGLSETRLRNIRLTGNIPHTRRRADVEFGLHEVVAPLAPDAQTHWLDRAATEGWTRRELRMAVRAAERRIVAQGQAETMHTLEVVVRLTVEAPNAVLAEEQGWTVIKAAVAVVPHAHVIAARALTRLHEEP